MSEPVYELRRIARSFGRGASETHVLKSITLDIEAGEFVSIVGPSGSGKSTLMNIMGMLDAPTGGQCYFMGEPIHEMSEQQRVRIHREHIGFVFQAYHLIDDMTVYENLETPLLYRKIKTSERKSIIADVLDRFNMVAKRDLFPEQLSGGQQQLVGVARALVISPRVILADEPTGNLHSSQGDMIMELLRTLNVEDGVTIIQVTHNEAYANLGDRVIELLDGGVKSIRDVGDRAENGRVDPGKVENGVA